MGDKHSEKRIVPAIKISLILVAILWVVKFLEWATDSDLGFLGVLPRQMEGLVGIFTSPFIHGDFLHLMGNSFSLLVLISGLFYFHKNSATKILIASFLGSQWGVWLMARPAYHIGASGIVYALLAFHLFSGIFRRNRESLALSGVVFVMHHGFVLGLFPSDLRISWESHLMGFIVGMILAWYFRKTEMTETVSYQWNDEEDENLPSRGF